ncbi:MAG: PAS domain-containing protein [Hymenobacteraceae bacterium]|nr:PAS domain-containing protein [Hymenobacteraceae bacterium]
MLETNFENQPVLGPVFRSLPGLYLVLTPDLVVVDATDAYLHATLSSREAIMGKYFFDAFPNNPATPDLNSAGEFEYSLRYVLRERQPHAMPVLRYDLPCRRENGTLHFEERYWSPSNSPVFDTQGNVTFILHEARDITEQVQNEQNRQHNTERLTMLTSALNAVSWEYDILQNKMHWGKGLKEVFGYTPEEMGPGGESWDERVHPEDYPIVHESIEKANAAGDKIWQGEYRFLKADGTYAHVLDQGYTVYDQRGRRIRTIGSIIDLSHSKKAEESLKESDARFRHLLENLPHMAWTADPKGKILYFNDNWYSYTGMQKGQTEGWINFVHPEDSADVLTTWHDAITSGSLYEIEYRIRDCMDGSYRTFLERGVPMYEKKGEVKLWIGTYTDIEDQKQTLEQIRMKDRQLVNILKLSPAHLCLLEGPRHICRYVTPGVYRMYGNRAYLGRPAPEVWPELQKLGFPRLLDQIYEHGEAVYINELCVPYDRLMNGNVENAYFNFKYQPMLGDEGNVAGILISAIEVTELVEAKRRAETLAKELQQKT